MKGRDQKVPAEEGKKKSGAKADRPRPGADECICPNCGHLAPKPLDRPCFEKTCPKCGAQMDEDEL